MNKKGMTLTENVISIVLVTTLLFCVLGAFLVSRLSEERAKHRMMAMNKIRENMEQEIKAGYLGGYADGDCYVSVTSASPVTFTIDDMGTTTTDDDLTGTVTPDPYPGVTYTIGTDPKTARYKKVGFMVEWNEKFYSGIAAPMSRERAVAYVAEHN